MSLLSEEDLNDFISPALACTKPTEIKKTTIKNNVNEKGEYEVGVDDGEDETLEKVTITLSDCLACSGCITSSEEIMLQQQSHGVFLEAMSKCDTATTKLAVSISPQCRLSMATYYGIDIQRFDKGFARFFKEKFNAVYIVGTQLGRNISIQQAIEKLNMWKQSDEHSVDSRPRLSAADPGFVIYTEKTKPDLVPLLLNVKSPQQITGALLHETFEYNHPDQSLYVLGVMACFDKKLEASRPDGEGEVNCVITPKEFVAMLSELGEDFSQYLKVQDDDDDNILVKMCPEGWDPELHWCINNGSSSGGFAYQYIVSKQRSLIPELQEQSKIVTIAGKNNNICEYRLLNVETGDTIASASELSGFRNIQNMVRHLSLNDTNSHGGKFPKRRVQSLRKRQTTQVSTITNKMKLLNNLVAQPYKSDFIEVNAAPGGCLNGSGLLNEEQSTVRKRQFIQQLETIFHESFPIVDPLRLLQCNKLYEYQFHAAEPQKQKDIVTVGNTW